MEKDATVTEYVRLFFMISYLICYFIAFSPPQGGLLIKLLTFSNTILC